jgi:DNA helicase-2/ATP-dependent DNA helicase PcrA
MTYNEAQLKAINKNEGNTAVIATAGSGKTAVITKRIERLITDNIVEPQHILAITFSRKARENIENRLSDTCNDVNVETFHSLALKIVQSSTDNKYTLWTADWEKSKALFNICKDMRLISNDSDLKYNEIMRFIARQKNEMRDLDNLLYDIDDPYNNKDMLCIYKKYEKHKEQNNLIEFDDLLNETLTIFKTMPDVLEFYQEQYQFILVDEFQDVSLNQALFLKELS